MLASNLECIEEIASIIGKENFIKNCLLCYSVDFSAQPDLDEALCHFSLHELVSAYKKLDLKPIETAGALMWLLEELDPTFSLADIKTLLLVFSLADNCSKSRLTLL